MWSACLESFDSPLNPIDAQKHINGHDNSPSADARERYSATTTSLTLPSAHSASLLRTTLDARGGSSFGTSVVCFPAPAQARPKFARVVYKEPAMVRLNHFRGAIAVSALAIGCGGAARLHRPPRRLPSLARPCRFRWLSPPPRAATRSPPVTVGRFSFTFIS